MKSCKTYITLYYIMKQALGVEKLIGERVGWGVGEKLNTEMA